MNKQSGVIVFGETSEAILVAAADDKYWSMKCVDAAGFLEYHIVTKLERLFFPCDDEAFAYKTKHGNVFHVWENKNE